MRFASWLSPRRSPRPRPRLGLERLEARDNPSGGLLDPTFNGTGTETFSSSVMRSADDVTVQPDGKIVSVGFVQNATKQTSTSFQVIRLNSDGTFHTTFNGTGKATINFGVWTNASSVALQPDGKILVGGRGATTQTGVEYVVARLNANGSLDTTFGNTGRKGAGGGIWAYNASSTATEYLRRLAVLTDSSNHLTGIMVGGELGGAFEAIKLTPAGVMDTTFGVGGDAVVSVGAVQIVGGMAVTPSNGVVMVGTGQGHNGVILALTPTGQMDTTFNGTGYRVDNVAGATGTYYDAVTVQPTAGGGYRLVVAGCAFVPGPYVRSGLVVAYTSGGQFDTSFAAGGLFTTAAAGEFTRVALEADGSIVVAGYAYYTAADGSLAIQVATGHLSADGAADTTFGTAGNGISLVPPPLDGGTGLAIDPLGRIVLCYNGGNQAVLARLTAP